MDPPTEPPQSSIYDVKYPYGNSLIHELVVKHNNTVLIVESYILETLRSYPAKLVNERNDDGLTALQVAVVTRNYYMAKTLLSSLPKTIDVNADCAGATVLHFAAGAEYHFDSAYLNTKNHYSQIGSLEVVRALLKCGASLHAVNRSEEAPIHIAAKHNRFDIIRLFIDNGSDLKAKNCCGWTPLHSAADSGCWEAVKVLVDNGAALDECSVHGCTPLYLAVNRNRHHVLQLLIWRGANMDIADNWRQWTPIRVAAEYGYSEAFKVLVDSGAYRHYYT